MSTVDVVIAVARPVRRGDVVDAVGSVPIHDLCPACGQALPQAITHMPKGRTVYSAWATVFGSRRASIQPASDWA